MLTEISKTSSDSRNRKIYVARSVSHLLGLSCPTAIGFRITSMSVWSFQALSRWARSHCVNHGYRRIFPFRGKLDALRAVIFVTNIIGIVAARFSCRPITILLGRRKTMLGVAFCSHLFLEASTGLYAAITKTAVFYGFFLTALAPTKTKAGELSIFTSFGSNVRENFKPSKCLTDDVSFSGHNDCNMLLSSSSGQSLKRLLAAIVPQRTLGVN